MVVRIITAVVAILVLLPILIFSNTVVLPIAATIFCGIAVYEMLRCCGVHRRVGIALPLLLSAVCPCLAFYWTDRATLSTLAMAGLIVLSLYFFTYLVFKRGKSSPQEIAVPFFCCFYIVAAFSAIVVLRGGSADGKYVYLICFIGAWVTDIFAYFCGRLFGKHKLIPEISPKKTVEGSVGGVIFCVLSMLLYGFIVQRISGGDIQANYLMLGVSGLFISFVSQIGDLCMSALKRTYGIKDFGKLFPGHGGVLDRFDSVLAVSLVLLLVTSFGPLFIAA
jgi:phosphatidate cytidylyltransferase